MRATDNFFAVCFLIFYRRKSGCQCFSCSHLAAPPRTKRYRSKIGRCLFMGISALCLYCSFAVTKCLAKVNKKICWSLSQF